MASWFSKKQTSIVTSTAEVEYIATEICFAQKQQLRAHDIDTKETPIFCDNTSVITILYIIQFYIP